MYIGTDHKWVASSNVPLFDTKYNRKNYILHEREPLKWSSEFRHGLRYLKVCFVSFLQ